MTGGSDGPAPDSPAAATDRRRILSLDVDAASFPSGGADSDHDRRMAIFDLLEANTFSLPDGQPEGPYRLNMGAHERGFFLRIADETGAPLRDLVLSLAPFRKTIKDYLVVCGAYYQAIRDAAPAQIEAIDMGRRGLHNEGAQMLRDRLAGKVELDLETARRLFTLLAALRSR